MHLFSIGVLYFYLNAAFTSRRLFRVHFKEIAISYAVAFHVYDLFHRTCHRTYAFFFSRANCSCFYFLVEL